MKTYITKNALDGLREEANKGKFIVWDTELEGFGVNVTRQGPTSYVMIYRDAAGGQRQRKVASYSELTPETARAEVRKQKAAVEAQRPAKQAAPQQDSPTLAAFFRDRYYPRARAINRSYATHASLFRNHVGPELGDMRLADIGEETILAFQEHLCTKTPVGGRRRNDTARPLAESTVKRILIMVRHLFNEAIRAEVPGVISNPTAPLNLGANRTLEGRFLTSAEAQALIATAEALAYTELAAILRLMLVTGLRRDNVLAMEWNWVSLEQGMIHIPRRSDKAKWGYAVHLPEEAVTLLRKRWQEARGGLYVFPNPDTGRPYKSCYNAWNTVRHQAGLPQVTMHDLRHTYASWMLDAGAAVVDVQKALGHTQITTTMAYLHVRGERRKAFAQRTADQAGLAFD